MGRQVGKLRKRLDALFEVMDDSGREMLVEYAEFIAQRHPRPVSMEPLDIPRPKKETVVAAIRRLTDSFPMLDRATLLSETSGLMAQHIVHGRDATEVINELESMFRRHYAAFESKHRSDDETATSE